MCVSVCVCVCVCVRACLCEGGGGVHARVSVGGVFSCVCSCGCLWVRLSPSYRLGTSPYTMIDFYHIHIRYLPGSELRMLLDK
jgi:hypothetical protein